MGEKMTTFRSFADVVPGMVGLVVLAAGLGLAFNALNPNGLSLVRKPLRETRRFVNTSELLAQAPGQVVQPSKTPATRLLKKPIATPVSVKTPPITPQKPTLAPERPVTLSQTPSKSAPPAVVPANMTVAAKPESAERPQTNVRTGPEQPQKKAEALFTNLNDAKTLFDQNLAVFLDARDTVDYEAEHIPGARSLFCEKVDDLYKKVLSGVSKSKIIVTYCSDPECTEAIDLADALVSKGYDKVVILLEGLPGWKDAGYSTTKDKEHG